MAKHSSILPGAPDTEKWRLDLLHGDASVPEQARQQQQQQQPAQVFSATSMGPDWREKRISQEEQLPWGQNLTSPFTRNASLP